MEFLLWRSIPAWSDSSFSVFTFPFPRHSFSGPGSSLSASRSHIYLQPFLTPFSIALLCRLLFNVLLIPHFVSFGWWSKSKDYRIFFYCYFYFFFHLIFVSLFCFWSCWKALRIIQGFTRPINQLFNYGNFSSPWPDNGALLADATRALLVILLIKVFFESKWKQRQRWMALSGATKKLQSHKSHWNQCNSITIGSHLKTAIRKSPVSKNFLLF